MGRGTEPSTIAFAGDFDSGKTTLLERLLPATDAGSLAVAGVKHASHGCEADRSSSDFHGHCNAGAPAVMVQALHAARPTSYGPAGRSERSR